MDEEGPGSNSSEAYEHSEMVLYKAMVLEEGELQLGIVGWSVVE